MKKILITGGAGFIGYFLSQKLLALGLEVVGSLPFVSLWWIQKIKPNLNDKYYLLKELEKEEKQSQRELAKVLGFSLGKLNFVLKALIVKGLVKMEKFAHSEQKIQYRYILTPDGIKEKIQVTAAFIERKQAEYEKILQEIDEARQTFPSWTKKLKYTSLDTTGIFSGTRLNQTALSENGKISRASQSRAGAQKPIWMRDCNWHIIGFIKIPKIKFV